MPMQSDASIYAATCILAKTSVISMHDDVISMHG